MSHRESQDDLGPALEATLAEAPRSSFFALVERLERALGGPAIGTASHPSEERLRFRHSPSLGFSASDVESAGVEGDRVALTTTFLGLTGSASPLPLYFAEEVLHEGDEEDIRRPFLDLFHHRSISLFYRLCRRYRPATGIDEEGQDAFSQQLRSLAAVDDAPEVPSAGLDGRAWARLVPLLARTHRGARGLRAALRHLLGPHLPGVRVEVRELAGEWSELDTEDRMKLGRSNHALGHTTLVGGQVRDPASQVAVEVGPVGTAGGRRLRRGGDLHALIEQVAGQFVRGSCDIVVHVIHAGAREGFALGGAESELGVGTTLASTSKGEDGRNSGDAGPMNRAA